MSHNKNMGSNIDDLLDEMKHTQGDDDSMVDSIINELNYNKQPPQQQQMQQQQQQMKQQRPPQQKLTPEQQQFVQQQQQQAEKSYLQQQQLMNEKNIQGHIQEQVSLQMRNERIKNERMIQEKIKKETEKDNKSKVKEASVKKSKNIIINLQEMFLLLSLYIFMNNNLSNKLFTFKKSKLLFNSDKQSQTIVIHILKAVILAISFYSIRFLLHK